MKGRLESFGFVVAPLDLAACIACARAAEKWAGYIEAAKIERAVIRSHFMPTMR